MKFARTKESTKELKEKGIVAPDFDDVDVIPHNEYLEAIKQKDAVLGCVTEPEPLFPDNLQGECDDCGTDIYYRPYNKDATTKLCTSCVLKRMEKEKPKKPKTDGTVFEDFLVLSKVQQKIFDKVKDEWETRIGKGHVNEGNLKRIIIMADTQFDGKKRVTVKGTTYLVPIEDIVLYGLKASEIDKYPKEMKK